MIVCVMHAVANRRKDLWTLIASIKKISIWYLLTYLSPSLFLSVSLSLSLSLPSSLSHSMSAYVHVRGCLYFDRNFYHMHLHAATQAFIMHNLKHNLSRTFVKYS